MRKGVIDVLVLVATMLCATPVALAEHVREDDIRVNTGQGEIGVALGRQYLFASSRQSDSKSITFTYRLANATGEMVGMEYKSALLSRIEIDPKHDFPVVFTLPLKLKNLDIEFSYSNLLGGDVDAVVYKPDGAIPSKSVPAFIPRERAFKVAVADFGTLAKGVVAVFKTLYGEVLELKSRLEAKEGSSVRSKIVYTARNKGQSRVFIQWLSPANKEFPSGLLGQIEPGKEVVLWEIETQGESVYIVSDFLIFNEKDMNVLPRHKVPFLGIDTNYKRRLEQLRELSAEPNRFVLIPAVVPAQLIE